MISGDTGFLSKSEGCEFEYRKTPMRSLLAPLPATSDCLGHRRKCMEPEGAAGWWKDGIGQLNGAFNAFRAKFLSSIGNS